MISMTFRWPHMGMLVGFEFYDPTDEQPWSTMRFHFLLASVNVEFGDGPNPYN